MTRSMQITVPPHYIKHNEQARVPRRWVYLDTEAVSTFERDRITQSWRLGVTCFEHCDNDKREWVDPEWRTWHSPDLMWDYISSCAKKRSRTIVLAHNIGYDLRISEALTYLPEYGWELDLMSIGGRNLSMTLRRDGATLVLADFMSWVPTALADIGPMVGMAKLDLPTESDPLELWVQRCASDVEILRRANRELVEWVHDSDLGNWQKTGASMAWSNWRHAHYTDRVLCHSDNTARELEVAASATGRCEALMHGKLPRGVWVEWDLPLAYPRVALDTELPTQLLGHDWAPTWDRYKKRWPSRRALLSAEVTTETPVLPLKVDTGWVWPVGTFRGTWWDHELELAVKRGAQVKLTHAVQYKAARALSEWAAWVISVIDDESGTYTPLQRAAAKHWGRALIGRFGAKFPSWELWGEATTYGLDLAPCFDMATGKLGHMLTVGTQSYLALDESWVADANPAIMGAVISECRVRLWQLLEVAGFENVAYVDTDSLIVNRAGDQRLQAHVDKGKGWGLRVKARHRTLEVLGPRQLIIEQRARIAGVPKRAKRTAEREWTGERWDGVATTLATKQPSSVVIRDAIYRITGVDNRRIHLPGHATLPIRIEAPGG